MSNGGEEDTDLWEEMKVEADERLRGSVTMETLVEKKVSHDNGRAILSPLHDGMMEGWRGEEEDKNKQSSGGGMTACGPVVSLFLSQWSSSLLFSLTWVNVTASYLNDMSFRNKSKAETIKCLQVSNLGSWLNYGRLSWNLSLKARILNTHTKSLRWLHVCVCNVSLCLVSWLRVRVCEHMGVCFFAIVTHLSSWAIVELISFSPHSFDWRVGKQQRCLHWLLWVYRLKEEEEGDTVDNGGYYNDQGDGSLRNPTFQFGPVWKCSDQFETISLIVVTSEDWIWNIFVTIQLRLWTAWTAWTMHTAQN